MNELLASKYEKSEYRIYGREIKEGYVPPCFFTEIVDKGSQAETRNFKQGSCTLKITYFQKIKNELDQLQKVDEIKELFGLVFLVGERKITVGEITHDYIGEYQDILQISVDISYLENTEKKEFTRPMEKLHIKLGGQNGSTEY